MEVLPLLPLQRTVLPEDVALSLLLCNLLCGICPGYKEAAGLHEMNDKVTLSAWKWALGEVSFLENTGTL